MLSLKSRYPERLPLAQAQTREWRRVKVAGGVCLTEVAANRPVCDSCPSVTNHELPLYLYPLSEIRSDIPPFWWLPEPWLPIHRGAVVSIPSHSIQLAGSVKPFGSLTENAYVCTPLAEALLNKPHCLDLRNVMNCPVSRVTALCIQTCLEFFEGTVIALAKFRLDLEAVLQY